MGWYGLDWTDLTQDMDQRRAVVNTAKTSWYQKVLEIYWLAEEFLACQGLGSINYQLMCYYSHSCEAHTWFEKVFRRWWIFMPGKQFPHSREGTERVSRRCENLKHNVQNIEKNLNWKWSFYMTSFEIYGTLELVRMFRKILRFINPNRG